MAGCEKRLVNYLVLSLGLILSVALVLMNGCGAPITVPDNGTDNVTPTPTPVAKYVGADVCITCHRRIHDNWTQTAHAGAFNTLKAIGQDNNSVCVACHTVGFGEGGFVNEAATPGLAGVQCENCHGPGYDHVNNVEDESLRPPKSMAGSVCGKCHTDAHHPTFDEWSASGHGKMLDHPGDDFEAGKSFTSCGICHSGDARQQILIDNNTSVTNAFLKGVPIDQQNAQTCAVCHDPHARTGNDIGTEPGHDFQLRYAEVANPTPSDNTTDTTNPSRFNLCGQCHHSRGANWTATSRGPHHSIQANMYVGEMDSPDNITSLVPHESSIHAFVPGQCATCHMYAQDFENDATPAVSGHSFDIDLRACYGASGCHPSEANVTALKTAFQAEIQAGLDSIKTRLGDPTTWEYSSSGGPTDQKTVPDTIKKVRFLYYWVINDGSLGIHNPEYVRSIINTAGTLLTSVGK